MIDIVEIQKILPHRYPFLLIDRVTELEPAKHIVAYKNVTIGEPVFQGHFPGHPIYPGVMIIEGMAQAGGVLAFKSMSDEHQAGIENKVVYFMSIDGAKFSHPIRPRDRLEYRHAVLNPKSNIGGVKCESYVDGTLACEAELKAMIVDK